MKLLVALGTDWASPDQLLLTQSLTSLRRRAGVEGEGVMRTGGGGIFPEGRGRGGGLSFYCFPDPLRPFPPVSLSALSYGG